MRLSLNGDTAECRIASIVLRKNGGAVTGVNANKAMQPP
jgi:hypothetical protein